MNTIEFFIAAIKFLKDHAIELLGAIIGLAYIILEYCASWWLWIAGIVMALFYIYIFYNVDCYAWTLIYLYYLGANIYGIIAWKKNSGKNFETGISNLPKKYYLPLGVIIVMLLPLIFIIVLKFTDSQIPVSESVTTALSIIGMWLLAKKYLQHWNIWMIVNPITALGSFYIGLYFSGVLFTIYFVVSIMGFIRWRKLAGK
jgi:nicotinamide mononucleotide transporter